MTKCSYCGRPDGSHTMACTALRTEFAEMANTSQPSAFDRPKEDHKDRLIRELMKALKECRSAIAPLVQDDPHPLADGAFDAADKALASARAQGYEPND